MRTQKNWLAYLVFFLVLGLVGCGEDKNGGSAPAAAALGSIDDITSSPDRRELVGRTVDVEDGTVQAVVGNFIFWGGDAHNQIPVVREDKLAGPVTHHVKPGDRVRIHGTVRLVDSVPETDRMWETISTEEKQQIKNATVYIAADTVQIK